LALSVVLLVTAGLLLRSFIRLQAVRPGFDPSNVLAIRLALMQPPFPTPDSIATFYDELRKRIEQIPGVQAAGAVSILPMSGILARADFTIMGRPPVSPQDTPSANYRIAGPGYFKAMRIQLLNGRYFADADTRRASKVAIVNQSLARRFSADSAALGAHMRIDGFGSGEVEIIGVVADVKQSGLADKPGPDLYLPYAQAPSGALVLLRNNMYWVIRSSQEPLRLSAAARRAVYGMKKDVAVSSSMTLDQYLRISIAPRKFNLVLVATFAASAMFLAVIAVYGVVSFAVTRRTREIGLRIALGAQRANVLTLVLGQGLMLTLAGIGVGVAGALVATRFLSDLLYQTQAFDTITFATVTGMLVGAGLMASYIPARRAIRLDPLVALRQD
jgi:putative ABC transport system permease protein